MGHLGVLIIPTAPLCCRKPIKSPPDQADGRYHLLPLLHEIISSALKGGDIGLSAIRQWDADAELPMVSNYLTTKMYRRTGDS
ncbi:hypothetical protein CesoFtcFv8_018696 [Champsocephalus esox]|uniref:Uncharacterized protein n=3 Tax=Channichthyidae TaxID=30806 RepID=A0AAN8HG18_CHAGU|nr:hypothetical protein KUCAC02_008455 [Chaenocephalus aceratus]KAK5884931.1 hypothetical protein CesoFtcFv8_018696 [Champsocephalus esox]KAK5914002.1 hypothetical protein CgunFtcFv8_008473 [Champsocephalus gunnari]